jgi:lactate dehydrogenase-like 2-hydroxyacid dehydrogenase
MKNKVGIIALILVIIAGIFMLYTAISAANDINEGAIERMSAVNTAEGAIVVNQTNQTIVNQTDLVDTLAQQRIDKFNLDIQVEKAYRDKLIDQLEAMGVAPPYGGTWDDQR